MPNILSSVLLYLSTSLIWLWVAWCVWYETCQHYKLLQSLALTRISGLYRSRVAMGVRNRKSTPSFLTRGWSICHSQNVRIAYFWLWEWSKEVHSDQLHLISHLHTLEWCTIFWEWSLPHSTLTAVSYPLTYRWDSLASRTSPLLFPMTYLLGLL